MKRGLLPLLFLVALLTMYGASPTYDVAFAVTGNGSVNVTIPASVEISITSSSIDFGTIPSDAQTVDIGTTTYYVLDSEHDATVTNAKISRNEGATNIDAIYYISGISASVSGFENYIYIKRDMTRGNYGYYTPGIITTTLQDPGVFTATLPSGYTEIAQAEVTIYVRSSSDGNTRNYNQVTIYFELAQDGDGAKHLFVDDDTDFTDSASDSNGPVDYTDLHQVNAFFENPYTLIGPSFPSASGDTINLVQGRIANADGNTSSTAMGFFVLIIIPKGTSPGTIGRTITITGEAA